MQTIYLSMCICNSYPMVGTIKFPFRNKIKLTRPLDNYLIQTSVEGKVRFPPIQGKVGFPLKVFPPMDSHHKWNKQMYHTRKRLGKSLNRTPNCGLHR